jgi:gag-polypeptide of LTR copia-type
MLLNGNNYPSWACSVSLSLQGKGMLSHIIGIIEKTVPENQIELKIKSAPAIKTITAPTDQNWDQDNINVMNWLLNSM